MDNKRFFKKDEEFTCLNCGKKIEKLNYTTRDHCNHCLYSIHIDNMPGDRSNPCHGLLEPIRVEKGKKDTLKIIYRCLKCGKIKKNVSATDDDYEEILKVIEESSL